MLFRLKSTFYLLSAVTLVAVPRFASAVPAGGPVNPPSSIDALWGAICRVGNYFFAFILAGAVIAFIYAGYLFYSSGGGPKVDQAKKVLQYAFSGTAIAVLSKTFIVITGSLLETDISPFLCT